MPKYSYEFAPIDGNAEIEKVNSEDFIKVMKAVEFYYITDGNDQNAILMFQAHYGMHSMGAYGYMKLAWKIYDNLVYAMTETLEKEEEN